MCALATPKRQDDSEPRHSVSSRLEHVIAQAIAAHGGWLPFDRYMALALYEPELGYYARGQGVFGRWPLTASDSKGPLAASDFVTAPELTPLFAHALAVQVRQALQACAIDTVLEIGAGTGALAEGLLEVLGADVRRYCIVELSPGLRTRQAERLRRFADRVQWLDQTPTGLDAVVLGNEVLDAMPVQLLAFDGQGWSERGVAVEGAALVWRDRPSALRPPHDGPFAPGTVTEIHPRAEAFVAGLARALNRGAAFFVDYGFPAHEYYHPQRHGGTLMCHRAHRADTDPLADVGRKDITAHVDFTGLALAGQDAGFDVAGYTTQARFLLDCGLGELMATATLRERADAARLVHEHEMGELFKAIAFTKGLPEYAPLGFASGDRRHRL
jgi:SAM-dependent MidA family methyltransferase